MAKTKKSYHESATGHDIIDKVCEQNRMRNPEAYDAAFSMPTYWGAVKIGTPVTKINTVTGKKNMKAISFIDQIRYAVDNLQMADGEAFIRLTGATGDIDIPTHVDIVKFVKACIACSYNRNEEYSFIVSEFVKEVMNKANSLYLPIEIPVGKSKLKKLVLDELNDYLKEICDKNNIPYGQVVEQKRIRKSKVRELLDQAAN